MEEYNKHYIEVDSQGRITDGWSDAIFPNRDTTDAVCINEQAGYQFRLFPGGQENPSLYEWEHMVPLYKWDGQNVVERSADEINADIEGIPTPEAQPTTEERLKALEDNKAEQTDVDELNEALNMILNGVTE